MRWIVTSTFLSGLFLVAISIGMAVPTANATEELPGPGKVKCSGSNCVEGSSIHVPCEYPGRTCNTTQACGCSGTGETEPLCDCYK